VADTDVNELAAMVSGIAAGDQQAWNALVKRYAPLVWSVVRAHQLTPLEAEDVSQNVWLMVLARVKDVREPARLPGWLATTARREALRAVRQRALTHDFDIAEELVDTNPPLDDAVETDDRVAALNRALRQLTPRCQTIISLLLNEPPPSYAEISAALNMPVGSIGPMRGRCLDHLRRLLAEGEGMTETELLAMLRRSQFGAGEVPATVIDKANDALTARPWERDSSTPES
jgi:RNA polymerase sigma factor (sigma-70 family)